MQQHWGYEARQHVAKMDLAQWKENSTRNGEMTYHALGKISASEKGTTVRKGKKLKNSGYSEKAPTGSNYGKKGEIWKMTVTIKALTGSNYEI